MVESANVDNWGCSLKDFPCKCVRKEEINMSCKFHNPYHLQHNQQPRKNRIITEDKNGLFYIEVKNTVKPVLSGYRDETSTFIKRPFRNYATVGILAPY